MAIVKIKSINHLAISIIYSIEICWSKICWIIATSLKTHQPVSESQRKQALKVMLQYMLFTILKKLIKVSLYSTHQTVQVIFINFPIVITMYKLLLFPVSSSYHLLSFNLHDWYICNLLFLQFHTAFLYPQLLNKN